MAESFKPTKAYLDELRSYDELVFGASLHICRYWLSETATREWRTGIDSPNRSVAKYAARHPRWLRGARTISLVLAPLRPSEYYRGEPVWRMEGKLNEGHEKFSVFNQIPPDEEPQEVQDVLQVQRRLGIPAPTEYDFKELLDQLKHVYAGSGEHDL